MLVATAFLCLKFLVQNGAEYVKSTSCFNTVKASRLPRLF